METDDNGGSAKTITVQGMVLGVDCSAKSDDAQWPTTNDNLGSSSESNPIIEPPSESPNYSPTSPPSPTEYKLCQQARRKKHRVRDFKRRCKTRRPKRFKGLRKGFRLNANKLRNDIKKNKSD
jgi:hypothetical protein